MKTKFTMFIILLVGMVTLGFSAKAEDYGKTFKVTKENTTLDVEKFALDPDPGVTPMSKTNHIIVKNGMAFFIQLPKGHNVRNLSSNEGKLEGDRIRVIRAGSLTFDVTVNGTEYFVLAHVNYYGVLQYKGADAPATIVVTKDNEGTELYVPKGPFPQTFYLGKNKGGDFEEIDESIIPRGTLSVSLATLLSTGYSDFEIITDDGTSNTTEDLLPLGQFSCFVSLVDNRVAQEHNITINSTPHGTVTASLGKAKAGTQVTLSTQADAGYRLKQGSLKAQTSDGRILALSANSFTMPDTDVVVSAEFEPLPSRQIKISTIGQGTITATPSSAIVGTRIRLSITPAEGYRFIQSSLRVMRVDGTPIALTNNEFVMPDMDVSVFGEFEKIPLFDVLISPTVTHGTITATPSRATAGTLISLAVTPDEGYRLRENSLKVHGIDDNGSGGGGEDDVAVEKINVSSNNTFKLPTYTVVVEAEFEKDAVAPSITTATLPAGTEGTAYRAQLTASGTAPITWRIASGKLPQGVSLSTAGLLSGTPTVSGTFHITVKAENAKGATEQSYTLTITKKVVAPSITTATLPEGTEGTAYRAQLTASGTAPITWRIASGALPEGLTLSTAGLLSGTPAVSGTFHITVKAENAKGAAEQSYTLTITKKVVAPSITTTTLPEGTEGTAYHAQLTASGTAPITWSIASGKLPQGVTLSTAGLLSGTPTVSGTFHITVKAENAKGATEQSYTLTIAKKPMEKIAAPSGCKVVRAYQRDAIISWEAGGAEKEWILTYDDRTITVKDHPRHRLDHLLPETTYTVTLRAKVGAVLSDPITMELTTEPLSDEAYRIPHIYDMQEQYTQGDEIPVFWRDMEVLPTSVSFRLIPAAALGDDAGEYQPLGDVVHLNKSGDLVLIIRFEGIETEELTYYFTVK